MTIDTSPAPAQGVARWVSAVDSLVLRPVEDSSLEARLASIDTGLEREPEGIRRTFALQTHRVEPAGAIRLWPLGQCPYCFQSPTVKTLQAVVSARGRPHAIN